MVEAEKNVDWGSFFMGVLVLTIVFVVIIQIFGSPREQTYAELCPTILALSPTAVDSLAVFQEHEGCFEYAQSEKT